MNIKKKIAGLIESARSNMMADYDLIKNHSLSLAYPEGETAYFKQKIFELKQEISEKTVIGRDWTINGCDYDILKTDWIQRHTSIMLEFSTKYGSEDVIWEQLRLFLRQFFQLMKHEEILGELQPKIKYPDKFYAWYHKILIAIGKKAEQFTPGAKQEIIDFGKRKYNTRGHGFYQAYMEFDLTKRQSFVTGLHLKDRKKWKEVIIDISNNDIDVITYLKEFPN